MSKKIVLLILAGSLLLPAAHAQAVVCPGCVAGGMSAGAAAGVTLGVVGVVALTAWGIHHHHKKQCERGERDAARCNKHHHRADSAQGG